MCSLSFNESGAGSPVSVHGTGRVRRSFRAGWVAGHLPSAMFPGILLCSA